MTTETRVKAHLRSPHPRQADFIDSPAKRIIIRAGRRSGKTVGIAIKAILAFLAGKRVLYTAPTSEQTDRFWFEVTVALAEVIAAGGYVLNKSERYIELPGTLNRIKAKTAWDADSLRGDFADLLIFDEWQLSNEDAWDVVGFPMMIDHNGDAVFIYTPPSLRSAGISKAHDPRHAAKMYKAAGEDGSGRWARFHFTSLDNPFLSREGLAEATKDASKASYRQEILAEDDELSASHLVNGPWDESNCKIPRFEIPLSWPIYSGHDFGSANPAALFLTRAKLPLPPGAPAHLRYGDIVAWHEYLPGAGHSTQLNVDEYKVICKGRTVVASTGGSHQEDGSRGDYTKSGWTITEPPIGAQGGSSLRRQVDRVVAIEESNKLYIFEDMVFTLAEMMSCAWKYDKEGNRTNDIDGESKYHLCFVRGTMVRTIEGERSIESIRPGDLVATRQGFRPVVASGMTQVCNTVVVQFSDGSALQGTGNHSVWVRGKGFVPLTCLRYNDAVETWQENALYSPGNHITDTHSPSVNLTGYTSRIAAITSIVRFGNRLMDRPRQVTISIIRTGIGLITISPIWNLLPSLIMNSCTTRAFVLSPNVNTLPEYRVWELPGQRQTKGEQDSGLFVSNRPFIGSHKPRNASNAVKTLLPSSGVMANTVPITANQNIVAVPGKITKRELVPYAESPSSSTVMPEQKPVPVRVVDISSSSKVPVYNLTVDAVHEYYANGILVSNCACLRYVLSLSDFTPETVHSSGPYRVTSGFGS